MKKAILFVLAGAIYSVVVFGGMMLDDAVYSVKLEKQTDKYQEELYGEGWDAPPAIEGIPEQYQVVLNQIYVAVRDKWPAERLMDLGVVSLADHYGEESTDNIGFVLMDLNGDDVDELVIGTTAPVEEGGTAIFCICEDPENPYYAINSVEGELHYLHPGETEDAYEVEIAELNGAWVIKAAEEVNRFDFDYREGEMDPANRMTLELIPFSRYK